MHIDRRLVIAELEKQGKSEHAQKALKELPEKIDHEQHAQLLEKFGIDPGKLVAGGVEKELGRLEGGRASLVTSSSRGLSRMRRRRSPRRPRRAQRRSTGSSGASAARATSRSPRRSARRRGRRARWSDR